MPGKKNISAKSASKKTRAEERAMVYIREDLQPLFAMFKEEHPLIGKSDIINAALEFYLKFACHGVDNRMQPNTDANLTTERKEIWEDEKREAYRKIIEEAQSYANKKRPETS